MRPKGTTSMSNPFPVITSRANIQPSKTHLVDKNDHSIEYPLFLSGCMTFIGSLVMIGGFLCGIFFVANGDGYSEPPPVVIGIAIIVASLTFGLPFAAIGSYMSSMLRLSQVQKSVSPLKATQVNNLANEEPEPVSEESNSKENPTYFHDWL